MGHLTTTTEESGMYTIVNLQKRLGLPDSERDALASFTGMQCFDESGAPLAVFDAQALADHAQIWFDTCATHGVFRCDMPECRPTV
jgi:hypothetical protein